MFHFSNINYLLIYLRCPKCDGLAYVWQELAEKMNDKYTRQKGLAKDKPNIVIATADCTVESRLCVGKNTRLYFP